MLFATNLLGILTGGLVLMVWKDPEFRQVFRRSHLSAASLSLTALLLVPLGSSFLGLLDRAQKDSTRDMVQATIKKFLTRETLTFGDREKVDVERVDIAWNQNPPVIRVIVRVSDPDRPTFKQVSAVQERSTVDRTSVFAWLCNALLLTLSDLLKFPIAQRQKQNSY